MGGTASGWGGTRCNLLLLLLTLERCRRRRRRPVHATEATVDVSVTDCGRVVNEIASRLAFAAEEKIWKLCNAFIPLVPPALANSRGNPYARTKLAATC